MMNPSHCSNNSLFLGDLSKFCTEMELENLFSCCGQILDVKIKRNNNTGKTLSYGFVTFANEEIAARAMKTMDGTMFYGRKLRIRWAQYNARSHPINEQVINSVYVRFVSPKLDVYITEEDLHNVFDQFGSVVDVSIKESAIDKRTNRQSGYGFVHFSCDKAGVECAFQAVSALDNATVNGVTYYVELSKNLLRQFNEMHGNNGVGMGTSPMGGSGVSPTSAGGAAYHAPHHARVPSYGSMAYGGGVGGAGAGGRPPATAAFDNNAAAAAHYMAPPPHMQAPPQYMHPHAHEYYETDSYFPPAAPPATAAAALGAGVPLGYSPKASGYGSAGPSVPSLNLAPRPMRPQHIRDSSLGSMDPMAFGGQLSVRSYSGSTSPLPPHAVSPVNSSHGSLTPPHSLAGGGGSVRSGWSHGGVGNGGSNNTSMHSMHEFGVSPPRSGEEAFLLLQQQQSQMLQAQQLGLGAIRPVVPRLPINTAAAAPVGAPNVNNDYGMASMHHTPPMQGHKMPFTPSQVGGRQLQQPQQQQPVPQFAELLAQELRPYEMQQQQQQVQHMSYQHLFPVSSTSRSPLNRSVGSATSAAAAAGGIGVSGGFEDDPERLMGPRSRAGTLTVPPLNLNNKSPMAASAGYSSMVQKSFSMQQQQQMMQQQEARHRRTLTGEVHDVDSLTFEGLTMTPNGLGSFVELHGDRHGASLSPPPSLLAGLGTTSRSTDSNGSNGSGVTPTSGGGNSASGVPSLLFDANILNGVAGGGALSTAGNVTSSEEKINSDGLVSQAIKLLSPPGTPRDYAVLLGVNFL